MTIQSGFASAFMILVTSCGAVIEEPIVTEESTLVDFTQGIKLTPVFGGQNSQFQKPLALLHSPDGSKYYVLQKDGLVVSLPAATLRSATAVTPAVALDLTSRVNAEKPEGGLLGMAFHPNFATNGFIYVSYTAHSDQSPADMQSRISRFTSVNNGQTFQLASEMVLIRLEQPYPNHNGGTLVFGADGFLYASFGDGGLGGDPQGNGQKKTVLFGKIIRIDVNSGTPYAIPPSNPFALGGGAPEIWATGLRNPWKMSFDRQTGVLWAADVGQNTYEEVNKITKGANYGWNTCEGNHRYNNLNAPCATEGLTLPVIEYPHTNNNGSVTGGFVYRGNAIPKLKGAYIFGDFMSGRIFAFDTTAQTPVKRDMLKAGFLISSFGQNNAGEMFVIDYGKGRVLLIEKGGVRPPDEDEAVLYNFLSRDGVGSLDDGIGYYNTIEPTYTPFVPASTPPLSQTIASDRKFTRVGSAATTLDEWTAQNIGDLSDTSKVVSAFYRNVSDLGFWREMSCSRVIKRGEGGCRVRNWRNQTDKAANVANLGTVAMNVSAEGMTQFFVFDPNGLLTPVAVLDSEGFKAVPRLCTPCHGGSYVSGSNGDTGAIFREFEPSLLQARANITPAQAQAEWFALNQAIKSANLSLASEAQGAPVGLDRAKWSTNTYINEMYPNGAPPALDVSDDAHVPLSYLTGATPSLKAAKKALYKEVVAPYCMQCHRNNSLNFSYYANFRQVATGVPAMISQFINQDPNEPTGLPFMPQSEFMFKDMKANTAAREAITHWLSQPGR